MKIHTTLRYNRKYRLNAKGEASIDVDVYYSGKRVFVSTGVSVKPPKWSKTKNLVVKMPKADDLNKKIDVIVNKIQAFEMEILENGATFNSVELKKFILRPSIGNDYFIEFAERELERSTLAPSSVKTNQATLNHFITFSEERDLQVRIIDMDLELIEDFDKHLKLEKLSPNTIFRSHKNIKKFVNAAIRKKLMSESENPYKYFKSKETQSDRQALSIEEVKALEELNLNDREENLSLMRDMFLYSCYTGQRWSDVSELSKKSIITNEQTNTTTIKYTMQKVDRPMELPISDLFNGKAVVILNNYLAIKKGKSNKTKIFPEITNQAANRLLKVLGMMINTPKKLTFHVSRHTCGTMLAEITQNPFVIMQVLGHRDIKTSMIYIHLSQKNLKKQLQKINWN